MWPTDFMLGMGVVDQIAFMLACCVIMCITYVPTIIVVINSCLCLLCVTCGMSITFE